MADYCILGYLDTFVRDWQIHVTILSWLAANKKMSHAQVWQAIQDDPDLAPAVKALEQDDIRKIMDWMFKEGMVGKPETQSITYTTLMAE